MTSGNRAPGNHPIMMSHLCSARVVLCTLIACLLSVPVGPMAGDPAEKGTAPERDRDKPVGLEEQAPVARGPIPIRAPRVEPVPAAGRGRLSLTFEGNRRWCTFPDDRLRNTPAKTPRGPKRRREVFTFGYQFSVAAVESSRPGSALLLYASPVIRTATLRQAGKLGRGHTPGRTSPMNPAAVSDEELSIQPQRRETPATLVPHWDEAQRCAMVGEQFDFDIDPGRYDIHLSFDIMIRSGAWVHRTYAYLTDIEVVEGSRTIVDGVLDMRGGGRRDLQLRSTSIESLPVKGAARH